LKATLPSWISARGRVASGTNRVSSSPPRSGYRGKRLLDLACVAALAAPAAVIAAVCGVAVRLTSSGPALFRQCRVGRDGQPFTILKFRTMIHADNPLHPETERITTVGRWLRRSSLDELPQLWNVLRGEMSIVGPRPTLAYQVDRYTPRQRRRLSVLPGITGLAQIRGRNSISWSQRIDFDLEYVERQSLQLDLAILSLTLFAVLKREGVEGHPRDDPLARVEDCV
jgi:lipopolysaccharide/colanic/teichoic acid biosynthesis glycosyltransferase